ncbi:phospho-sugar mutase [Gordonia polyisoprenivorans]|uniref:phospho-sugar mutase n=1 Tax=Gordonia polyisoprenivorans TaxID=84595 RepID=UPI001E4B9706|nr:phospho-sugar mutase [Gordonia polyisoprenivorans]
MTGVSNGVLTDGELIARAAHWCAHDPDAATRAELGVLITGARSHDPEALAELRSRCAGPLEFGTAGLRAAVGAGESRMNTAVVIRATAGLARYLLDVVGPDAAVVVGCDARHGSSRFRTAALQVLSGAGLRAIALPEQLPTPITAYAVRALDADAGIMITASHNPPADNGYKVYLGGRATDADGAGVQIVPPADAEIASRIADSPPADEVPRTDDRITGADPALVHGYLSRTAGLRRRAEPSPVRVVLTAMHGVGGSTAMQVLRDAGIGDVHPVQAQFLPDPDFPTVAFPNPEEPGAIDLAIAHAREVDADVVIALDPDADRCSVATSRDGLWRQLSGDEIGALLGEQAAADDSRPGDTLACSIVSSRLLGRIAAAHGLRFAQTLTGFKWIARTPGLRFGYEEAIGYCTDPDAVHDKDGIGAAVRMITLVEDLAATGAGLEDQLDRLAHVHGLHSTSAISVRVENPAVIEATMTRLRSARADRLVGEAIVEFRDLARGGDDLPPTDALLFRTAADDRVIVRPSGTEPKLKCYLEVVIPADDVRTAGVRAARATAQARLGDLATELTSLLGL